MFHARFHAFLIIQTVLLTATSVVRSGSPSGHIVGDAIPIAALILSLMWGYVQYRQKRKLDVLIHRLEKFLPEFARTRQWTRPPRCWPSATTLLTYIVPLSFVILWSVIAGSSFLSG